MGAGASSTIELDEAKQFVSEWDARYEQRFMWAADSKGRVNRKAAERVLAKAERWSNFKARLPPESADTKAPVLPTCYIDANTASPTSIVTMSRSWNALLPVPVGEGDAAGEATHSGSDAKPTRRFRCGDEGSFLPNRAATILLPVLLTAEESDIVSFASGA